MPFDPSPNILAGYDPTGQGQIDDLMSINPEWSRYFRVLRQQGVSKITPGSLGFDQGQPIKQVTGLSPDDPTNRALVETAGPAARVSDQRFRLNQALHGLSGVK